MNRGFWAPPFPKQLQCGELQMAAKPKPLPGMGGDARGEVPAAGNREAESAESFRPSQGFSSGRRAP